MQTSKKLFTLLFLMALLVSACSGAATEAVSEETTTEAAPSTEVSGEAEVSGDPSREDRFFEGLARIEGDAAKGLAIGPLVMFTASKAKMGELVAPRWLTALAMLGLRHRGLPAKLPQ